MGGRNLVPVMSADKWIAAGMTALPVTGGYLQGLMFREASKAWYESLKTPKWKPPKIAFPIVWTSLYTGMGCASYLVWKEGGGFNGPAKLPLIMYGTQLAINYSWSPIFFGMGNLGGGLATIMVLDAAVATTGFLFYKVSHLAGYLFIPYMAWLSLASCLNYWIWKNNPNHPKPSELKEKSKVKEMSEVKEKN